MFFDQQESTLVTGMFAFPDFPYADVPVQPSAVGENIQIQGNNTAGRQVNITGTADQYGTQG